MAVVPIALMPSVAEPRIMIPEKFYAIYGFNTTLNVSAVP